MQKVFQEKNKNTFKVLYYGGVHKPNTIRIS